MDKQTKYMYFINFKVRNHLYN